jgi:hypothetical protein
MGTERSLARVQASYGSLASLAARHDFRTFVAGLLPGYQRTMDDDKTLRRGEGTPQQAEDAPKNRPDEPGAEGGSGKAGR